MIKRLDRYLLGEMVLPFVGGILLIVVMLVGNTLFPLIEDIVKSGIPPSVVARIIVFNLPIVIPLTLPPGVALASAWAINRLARDSEITAIRMAGISLKRLFLPIILVGILATLTSFLVGDRVVPLASREYQKTEGQLYAYALQASPTVAANKVFTFQDYAFHIREIRKDPSGRADKLKLFGIVIYENPIGPDGLATLMTAQSADYDHDVFTLHGAHVVTFGKDDFVSVEAVMPTLKLPLPVPVQSFAGSGTGGANQFSMAELGAQMEALKRTGQDTTTVAYNYYYKLGLPLLCFGFALCAPPLALRFARAGAYTGIFLSIVMVFVAWNTLLLTQILGYTGKMPPMLAAGSPALLFMGLGIYFLWRME